MVAPRVAGRRGAGGAPRDGRSPTPCATRAHAVMWILDAGAGNHLAFITHVSRKVAAARGEGGRRMRSRLEVELVVGL